MSRGAGESVRELAAGVTVEPGAPAQTAEPKRS